jgi:CRP-like cAMP-binding protein
MDGGDMDSFEFFLNNQNRIIETYDAGDFLYRSGSPAIGIFFICTGKVHIIYNSDIREIKTAGDIIGLDEIEFQYFITDARAIEETKVYFFDRYLLQELK